MRTLSFTKTELKLVLDGLDAIVSDHVYTKEQEKPYRDLRDRLRAAAETPAAVDDSEEVDTMSEAFSRDERAKRKW